MSDVWARRASLWAGAFALVLLADLPRHVPPFPVDSMAIPVGALTGAALFGALARRSIDWRGLERSRTPALLRRALPIAGRSAYEEAIWRGLAFGLLIPIVGAVLALLLTTVAFALAHARRQGWGAVVHLGTGAAFGAVFYLLGSVVAAATAHVTYNLLITLGLEAERGTRLFRPIGTPASGAYAAPTTRREENTMDEREKTVPTGESAEPLELTGVAKRFGQKEALRGVDLVVREGEIVALLGPNGAGKTTAVSIMLGLRRPDGGTARLYGADPRIPRARRVVGATPQDVAFPWGLRVLDVIDLVRAHFPDPLPAAELLERFGLSSVADRQTGGLSGGQKRRLAVALAFAGRPRLLVLDEPTAGLDVEARRDLWGRIRDHASNGGSVLLTTHQLDEAEKLASRIAVIDSGRVVASGSAAEIRARAGLVRVRLTAEALPRLSSVVETQREAGLWTLHTHDADQLVTELVASGTSFSNLEVSPVPLEEAFLELTRDRS